VVRSRSHSQKTSTSDCPSDEALVALLEWADEQGCLSDGGSEATGASPGESLVAHLDGCEVCRRRLESLAADAAFPGRARHTFLALGASASRPDDVLSQRLPTWHHLVDAAQETVDEEPLLDVLAPCDVPGRIGRLDRYEVLGVLGRGGMGLVLKALDPGLDRLVAIKVLATPLALAPAARERFRREARAAAAVTGEYTVTIHAVEEAADFPYLVMEYVDGPSLQERIDDEGPLPVDQILRIGEQVAGGLAAAHRQGLIHRDVKPANILLDAATGVAKIGDFGLARAVDDAALTRAGVLAGTPQYMSPEQAGSEPVDHRTDLFSLGGVLYAMSTGSPPFQAETSLAVLRCVREQMPEPLERYRKDLPRGLVQVISRLLRKAPEQRFQTAEEVGRALRALRDNPATAFDDDLDKPAPKRARTISPPSGSLRIAGRRRWLLAAALVLVVAWGLSEATGRTRLFSTAVALLRPDRADDTGPQQELSRDARLKGAVAREKDALPEEPSPWQIRKFLGHAGPVRGVAFASDGTRILSCSGWPLGDRTLRLWNVASGNELREFDTTGVPQNPGVSGEREAPGEFQCLAITSDGQTAVTGGTGGAVCVWDVAQGKLLRTFPEHPATVYDVAIATDAPRVLSGGRDGTALLWDLESGQVIHRLSTGGAWVRSVAISADGQYGLVGDYDGRLHLWDLQVGRKLKQLPGNGQAVWSVAFAPDSQRAASAAGETIYLWSIPQGEAIGQLTGHQAPVTSVRFSPDGNQILSTSYDGTVRLWDAENGHELRILPGHRDWVWQAAFAPDGRTAVSAGGGRTDAQGNTSAGSDFSLRLWELP